MTAENPLTLLKKLDELRITNKLSSREMARKLDIPWETFRQWSGNRQRKPMPCRKYLGKIEDFVTSSKVETNLQLVSAAAVPREAEERSEKVRHLLLLLEDELRFFRDGPESVRDVFRTTLDPGDVGYISSLLGMLGDEGRFGRWLALTTNKFNYFRKERSRK